MEMKLSHGLHRLPLPRSLVHNPNSSNRWSRKSWKTASFREPPKSLKEVKNNRELPKFHFSGKCDGLRYNLNSWFKPKQLVMIGTHDLLHARTSGYFLVLVPLMAYCIICVIGSFHGKAQRDLLHEDSSKSTGQSRNKRWKHALADMTEPDCSITESADSHAEQIDSADDDQYSSAEAYKEYGKLERDYQRFLSECRVHGGHWQRDLHEQE